MRDAHQSVLLLVPEREAGGGARVARLLAAGLPSDEFRVAVGVLGKIDGSDADQFAVAQIPFESVRVRHAMDLSGKTRLRQLARYCQPEILHAWGGLAARAARWLVGPNSLGGNSPRLIISGAAARVEGLVGWLATRQLRSADRVVPATRAEGDRYRRKGVPAEQLTLIPPSAPCFNQDLDRDLVLDELALPAGARFIVAAGRSEKGLGPRDAIIAFDMLRYDLKHLYLAIPGAGKETPSLERLARSLAYDDLRVRFVPPSVSMDTVIQHAEAVFATRPEEGVEDALKAMAAGKPVIGWFTDDIAEIVEDKVTGLLVAPGDRAALAAAMRGVLERPEYARRLGEAGRARAEERFGLTRMVDQFARLYREIAPRMPVALSSRSTEVRSSELS